MWTVEVGDLCWSLCSDGCGCLPGDMARKCTAYLLVTTWSTIVDGCSHRHNTTIKPKLCLFVGSWSGKHVSPCACSFR
jgi:hypothetical protein